MTSLATVTMSQCDFCDYINNHDIPNNCDSDRDVTFVTKSVFVTTMTSLIIVAVTEM